MFDWKLKQSSCVRSSPPYPTAVLPPVPAYPKSADPHDASRILFRAFTVSSLPAFLHQKAEGTNLLILRVRMIESIKINEKCTSET